MARTCIGLDLGSSAVKLAQLKVGRGGSRELLAFGVEPLPSDSIVDGTIMNQSAVVDAVRALYSRLKLRHKDVAIAIAGHSVIIKKITVPPMSAAELDEQIPWEAEQHIPFAKDDVELDYQLVESRNPAGQMEVLLVAAKKEVVRDFAAVAREAQLNPVVIDVAAFALQNAFETAYASPPRGEAVVLINVGSTSSNINILSGGASSFTRDVLVGGHTYTEELKRQLNLPHEEAEAAKMNSVDGDESQQVRLILAQTSEQIAGEFSKSLDFFMNSNKDTRVTQVYLAGGASRHESLHRAIEQRAHVPVELMNPFRAIKVDASRIDLDYLHKNGPQGAVAVGLALRAPGDKFS